MAIIRSSATTDELIIDTTSKAARVTLYRTDGTIVPAFDIRNYYRASVAASFVAPAGTTPFFAIQGSSSKIVRIIAIKYNGMTLTTTAYQTIISQKRSSTTTGGTATALVRSEEHT